MKHNFTRCIKILLLVFYTTHITYSSLSEFLKSISNDTTDLKKTSYEEFLVKSKIYPIIYFFRLNAGFAFFGHGLYAAPVLEYKYYNSIENTKYTKSYADNFKSPNGKLRATTFSSLLAFSCIAPINEMEKELKKLPQHSSIEKDSIQVLIDEKYKILNSLIRQIGEYSKNPKIKTSCFEAIIYFLIPNTISDKESKRFVFEGRKYNFCYERKN